MDNFFWYHANTSETGILELAVRAGAVVDEEWVPARICSAGGNPQPLAGAAASEAVSDSRDLRRRSLTYVGFDGHVHDDGALVVDQDVADDVADVFGSLRRFVDAERSAGMPSAPGVITDGGTVTSLVDRLGWTWGVTCSEPDFQHVSLSR